MPENFFNILSKIGQVSIIIPLIIGVVRFARLNKAEKVLFILILFSAITSVIAWYLWSEAMNNLPLLHLYTIVEFGCWAMVFYFFFEAHITRRIVLIIAVSFLLFAVLNSVFIQEIWTFNSNSRFAESLILIGFSLTYYFKLFNEKKISHLEKNTTFWINAGVLIYFSSSFLLFGFSNLLLNLSSYTIKEVWGIHGVFLAVHYILIAIGLWIKSNPVVSR